MLDNGSDAAKSTTVQPQQAEILISKLGQVIPDDTASTSIKDLSGVILDIGLKPSQNDQLTPPLKDYMHFIWRHVIKMYLNSWRTLFEISQLTSVQVPNFFSYV